METETRRRDTVATFDKHAEQRLKEKIERLIARGKKVEIAKRTITGIIPLEPTDPTVKKVYRRTLATDYPEWKRVKVFINERPEHWYFRDNKYWVKA